MEPYHVLNYLVPGIVYWLLFQCMTRLDYINWTHITGYLMCYLAGMIISRLGSLFVDGIIRIRHKDFYADRIDIIKAEKKDERLHTILQDCNMFRAMAAMSISVLVTGVGYLIMQDASSKDVFMWIGVLLLLFLLFLQSYVKHVKGITERVKADLAIIDTEEKNKDKDKEIR